MKKHKPVISWDFDNTLFNECKGKLIEGAYKLYKEQADSGKYTMLITTYRSRRWCRIIKKLLPEAKILATGGYKKSIMLKGKYLMKGYNVIKHYDDDFYTINSINGAGINGVYVYDRNYKLEEPPEYIHWTFEHMVEFLQIDKNKVIQK